MKKLGKTELCISSIGLGADLFGGLLDEKTSFSILDEYVASGGNLIDSARIYSGGQSEVVLGKWLRRSQPKNVIIATKGAHYDFSTPTVMRLSRSDIESDLDISLQMLGIDCIDFYWLHRDDISRPIGEILEVMESFVRAGKIRYYGASNYQTYRLREAEEYAAAHGLTGFSAVSNQYSIIRLAPGANTISDPTIVATDDDALAYHCESGMPLVPFQATARGYFAKLATGAEIPDGLRAAYDTEKNAKTYAELTAFCNEHGCSMQTATLVATANAPFQIVPLTGVRSLEQLKDVNEAIALINKLKKD